MNVIIYMVSILQAVVGAWSTRIELQRVLLLSSS